VQDLTDLVTAARTNDPRVVGALADRFSAARFHLPLASLAGVKNRPETALDLGASLPLHQLRLDTGLVAVPLFTTLELCRACAKKLSWKTDGKVVKTLPVPGSMALPYLKELLLDPEIDRLILNPLSDGALHLARTEVEAMAQGDTFRTLWLYSRNGGLNRPVEIEGGSLLGSIWNAAGRAIARTEEEVEVSVEVSAPSEAPKPAPKEARKEPALRYIPLEPEAPKPKKKRS
jgi:SseB protein N-terminal domain